MVFLAATEASPTPLIGASKVKMNDPVNEFVMVNVLFTELKVTEAGSTFVIAPCVWPAPPVNVSVRTTFWWRIDVLVLVSCT